MEDALTALLVADAGLIALINDRVHWLRQPSKGVTFPFINLQRVSGSVDYHLQGPMDIRRSRVQLDVWADKYSEVKPIERAAIALLSGYRGTVSGVDIHSIFVDGLRDFSDQSPKGERQLFRVSIDLLIGWS